MASPAFQLYPADFLVGTADMTPEEVGVFIRLLCYQWSKEGLPDNDGKLAALAGCHGNAIASVRHKFRMCEDGKLRNDRMEKVRSEQTEYRAKQAQNATKGWEKRRLAMPPHDSGSPLAMPDPLPKGCSISSPSPSSVPSTTPPPSDPPNPPTPRKRKTKSEHSAEQMEGFAEFWTAYPKKKSRANAEDAWAKRGCAKLLAAILAKVTEGRISSDWTRDGGKWIPYPASWLNAKGWEDDFYSSLTGAAARKAEKSAGEFPVTHEIPIFDPMANGN